MRPLDEVASLLEDSMGGLSSETRIAAMETIFGSDAVRAASILFKEGAGGVQEMAAAMDKQGDASATAAAMSDNLKSKWEAFQGTVETLQIQIGSALAPALGMIIDKASELLSGAMANLPALFDAIGVAVGAVAGFFGPLVTAITDFWGGVAAGQDPLDALLAWFDDLGGFVDGAVGKLGEMAQAFIDWVGPIIPEVLAKLGELITRVWDWLLNTALPGIITKLATWAQAFIDWVVPLIPPLLAKLGELAVEILNWIFNTALPQLVTKLAEWAKAFWEWVGPLIGPLLVELGKLLLDIGVWIITVALPAILTKLSEWAKAFTDWVRPIIQGLIAELGVWAAAIWTWLIDVALPMAVTKLGEFAQAFLNWVGEDVLPKLGGVLDEIWTGISDWVGGILQSVGNKLAELGKAIVDGIRDGISGAWDQFVSWVMGLLGGMVDGIKDFFGWDLPSKLFMDLGMSIAQGLAGGMKAGIPLVDDAFSKMIGAASGSASGIGIPTLPTDAGGASGEVGATGISPSARSPSTPYPARTVGK